MSPSDNDIVLTAYARFELITDALRSTESPAERSTLLSLALRSGSHPALEPFHKDPLLPLDGRFVSLDAQIAGLNALIRGQMEPPSAIGSIGATLYLPASQSAIACRVRTVYLPMQPTRRWDPPSAIHPVSDDLEASARKALEAALHLLLFVCPGETPPFPARIFWGVDEVSNSILEATSGDSLQLPLALAFLSALTRLPIAFDIGATGAIQSPDQVRSVRFTDEKRAIFLSHYGNAATFLTPSIGSNLREFALKIGDGWRRRFATPVTGKVFSLPPSVTPTFVYAEIENAPIFWASHASLFRDALPLYEKIFADSATRYGGKTFSAHAGNGEGLGAIFADPTQATDAAVHLLHCTRAVIWDSAFGDSLPVRIGVHLGEGEPSGDTWRGSGPALALRIAGAASAHQILASAAVHAAVKPAMDWIDHGKHRLRDLSDAVTLWEITAAGLQSINVPPESLDTRHHNLPAVSSPLIGRENEIDNILKHLATERLVTLTGAGGVGKTRLAFAVAARALLTPETTNRFPDGAFYISLDEESRFENALASAVCEAVGVTKLSSLSAKKLLLVLDNAEGAADIVARFVKSLWSIAPEIILLVTSRIPIRLRGEKRVPVLPLDLPGDDSDEFEWKQASSVRLFLDRAQAGEENFTVTTQPERDALTGLLRRLDGLPLAIELAASRIRYLSIGEIESRLAESLRLLSTRDTDVPERHRTLLATLEWSYGLLSEPEQRLLSRVCEFVGGFGADAAEQVMGGDPDTLD
ncbi:MAG: adenylate/guanylate cyclase domain-containing protein, partial [Akkermansiaceae bacterium]|nr:adenylate/guanylate cyclase domain-containing protein [Armatimonadota bacterium]